MESVKKIFAIARPLYHRVKPLLRKIKSAAPHTDVQPDRLVFVFQGRSEEFGLELYKNDAEIRMTVMQCSDILIEMGGVSILPHFEQTAGPDFYTSEIAATRIVAIQLAVAKYFIDRDIYPNAVLATSSGIYAGAYAAGAISMRDALRLALGMANVTELSKANYTVLFLSLDFKAAIKLSEECPYWLEVIYEDSPQTVVSYCQSDDAIHIGEFLDDRNIKWRTMASKRMAPYHTTKIKAFAEEFIAFTEDVISMPVKCDVYFDWDGNVIRENSVINSDLWFEMEWKPSRFSDTLQEVLNNGYTTFLQLGQAPITERRLSYLTKATKVNLINSHQTDRPPLSNLEPLFKELSAFKFKKQNGYDRSEADIYTDFINHFDFQELNPIAALEYLRSHGTVHFLPKQNVWLVLGFDNTNAIFKNPDLYSSASYKQVDEFLLAADSEAHKVARNLLQPLFSTKTVNELASFIKIKAAELFDSVFSKDEFEYFNDFADPITEALLFNFLGFSDAEALEMRTEIGDKRESGPYWHNLATFFIKKLKRGDAPTADKAFAKVKYFMEQGTITFDEAVSILRILWTAGTTTTTTFNCSLILNLFKEPGMSKSLIENEDLIPKFINECFRIAPPANYVARLTTAAVELGGKQIPADSKLIVSIESANRDPAYFSKPNNFLLNRPAGRIFSFGANVHQCIGMAMAKAMVNEVVITALSRAPKFFAYTMAQPEYDQELDVKYIRSLKFTKKSISTTDDTER